MLEIEALGNIYTAILAMEMEAMTNIDTEPRCLFCGNLVNPEQDFRNRYQGEHDKYCPVEVSFHRLWRLFDCDQNGLGEDLLEIYGEATLFPSQIDLLAKNLVAAGTNTKKDKIVSGIALQQGCSEVAIHQQLQAAGYM